MTTTTHATKHDDDGPRPGGRSPWGSIQYVNPVIPGVCHVGTAGHGGFKLSAAENRKIPEALRKSGGWYEEDCEYAFVYLFHAGVKATLSEDSIRCAEDSMRNYYPDEYTALTGKPVLAHQSYKIRRREFAARHAKDWVGVAAIGDWHKAIPKGMVGVTASLGGRDENHYTHGDFRAFLVPDDEYETRTEDGFVIDLAVHKEVDPKTYQPITTKESP